MQIKPLRSMYGNSGNLRKGVIVDLPERTAQQLVKRGLAVPVQGKEGAKTATARPSSKEKSPTGGQRGKAKQSPSSQADQASKASASKNSEGAAE